MSDIEFIGRQLPNRKYASRTQAEVSEFAAALRENPGQWAKWPRSLSETSARTYARTISTGVAHTAFRGGGFEAEHRAGILYVRFIGAPDRQPCASCVGTGIDDPRDDSDCAHCGGTGAPSIDGPEDFAADRERDEQIGVCG